MELKDIETRKAQIAEECKRLPVLTWINCTKK